MKECNFSFHIHSSVCLYACLFVCLSDQKNTQMLDIINTTVTKIAMKVSLRLVQIKFFLMFVATTSRKLICSTRLVSDLLK